MVAPRFQDEWPSDEVGNVELLDEYGRRCKYRLIRLFGLGARYYVLMVATTLVGRPVLVGMYNLGFSGNAWIRPLDTSHVVWTFIKTILFPTNQSDASPREVN